MKIKFSSLPTSGEKIQVSFDGGQSFNDYNVEDVRESGIQLDENQDYSLIQVKSSSSLLKNLEVIKKISLSDPDVLSGCSFITDMTVDSSWPFCVTGIILPDGVTEIKAADNGYSCGESSFTLDAMFPNLRTIELPDTVTAIRSYAFYGSQISSLDIPNSVTTIDYNAFNGCTNLTSINIPDSVTSISINVFQGCSSLTSITIPDSVTTIGDSAFQYCSGLTSINISGRVTSISGYAFNGCTSLTSIEIPNSVTSIGQSAFSSCTSLTSIEIPNSVTSIGQSAFYDCSNLKTINYTGTEDQWNAIAKGTNWNKNCPSDMVINYNYVGSVLA